MTFGNQVPRTVTILCGYTIYISFIRSGVRLGPLSTGATTGLLYQPQMIDDGEAEVLGENLPQPQFVHHKSIRYTNKHSRNGDETASKNSNNIGAA
jgi:hypothetical protein